MKKYRPLRTPLFSVLVDRKAAWISLLLLLSGIFLFILSVGTGTLFLTPAEVVAALTGTGPELHQTVIFSFRMPRVLLAFLAGAALACSGAVLQGLVRNPLAAPDVLGITGGATVAAVSFLALFSDERVNTLTVDLRFLPAAACLGAILAGLLTVILAWKRGVRPFRLVLIGVGVSAAAQAITTTIILGGPLHLATQAHIWMAGSFNGTNWSHVGIAAPVILVLLVLLFLGVRKLNLLSFGDELATGAGIRVEQSRISLLLLSALLAGSAVAFAGNIGFIGLMAPHMARKLCGSAHGALLPVAALLGGILAAGADLIGRTAFAPLEVPAGIFTSALGAPYFLWLLYRTRNQ
ncbi:FecCD family ABC transporter permease [Staphylospora marina]|uniref:FecCD family ABC transporter permease n=1 Tax=Staphylospora marina TaxID=2490858 RepID=UPI000F5BD184|nr:iron ABC transporter permease [Staphylospora marina]